MTIREALNKGAIILKNEKVETPRNIARMVLEATLKKSRNYLIIYDKKQITPAQMELYKKNLKMVINGYPVQYLTGTQEFMKLDFFVNKNVLIPQPDTEILCISVLDIAENIENPYILDLGTGSGAIGISIAKYNENSKIVATDISQAALNVAKKNAIKNNVEDKIEFVKSDLFANLKYRKFDIIVSNPPYIPSEKIKFLPKDVQNEPLNALDGGKDGLDFYRRILKEANNFLNPDGFLCLEIGYDEKNAVKKLLEKVPNIKSVEYKKDWCQNDRVVIVKY